DGIRDYKVTGVQTCALPIWTMQITQPPQERMKPGLERGTRIAPAGLLVVSPLQVSAGAKRPPCPGQDDAAHLGFFLVDRIEGFGKAAEHVHGDRVHDLLVIELEEADRTIELERDVLELHGFSACCCNVSIWGRNAEKNKSAAERMAGGPGKVDTRVCDVTDPASVKAAMTGTLEIFGRVDGCFANAGIGGGGRRAFIDRTEEEWRQMF